MTTNGSPIIVEPTTPPNHPLPNIPHLSPHASSSSDSFDSSQPNSPASSATSRSDLPSPAPKSVGEVDSQESIELATLPSNPPLPETTPASQSQHRNEPPRSVPSNSAASSTANRQTSWLWYFGCLVPRGNWVSNILGSLNFWLALIGMLVFGNLAVWTARNDAFTTCSQIIIVSIFKPYEFWIFDEASNICRLEKKSARIVRELHRSIRGMSRVYHGVSANGPASQYLK